MFKCAVSGAPVTSRKLGLRAVYMLKELGMETHTRENALCWQAGMAMIRATRKGPDVPSSFQPSAFSSLSARYMGTPSSNEKGGLG